MLYDNTQMLTARINLLIKNGMIGLMIVFTLLWAFLNGRLSFWAGMGIPVSIAGAMAIVWALGGTTNMVSLFGLIMILGIVVDDAIIEGEAIYFHRKEGKPPLRAAVDGIDEVGMPVIAAVLTTIVAFVPLLYVGGVMGKFIAILPVVVIACLVVSLVECLILLPAHLSDLPDPNQFHRHRNPVIRRLGVVHRWTSRGLEWFVDCAYKPFLSKALYWRYISFCTAISVLLLTMGLIRGGILKFQVFPELDGFVMTATVEFPDGTPADVTQTAIRQMEAALLRLTDRTETVTGESMLEHRLSLLGQTLEEMPKKGPNVGSVQAIMLDSEDRGVHSKDLMVAWEKEIGPIPGVTSITFAGMQVAPRVPPSRTGSRAMTWTTSCWPQRISCSACANSTGFFKFDRIIRPGKTNFGWS